MKITESGTIMAAVLTESGAPFTKEGVECVKDMIVEKHPELEGRPILAMMGDAVRYPAQLSALLSAHPEMFVVVSYGGGEQLQLFNTKGSGEVVEALKAIAAANPGMTSWQAVAGPKGGVGGV